MLKFRSEITSVDPFNVGSEDAIEFEISAPLFDEDKDAWATQVLICGSQRVHSTKIYGASPLQSLQLAAGFLGAMYEPDHQAK